MAMDDFTWASSGSRTPTDDDTPDMGSKYLMDGFDYEQDYNEGVLDGARLPEVHGLSGLPDGFVTGEDNVDNDEYELSTVEAFSLKDADGLGLGEMLKEGSIVNLDWLDPTQFQDPERLPEQPVDKAIAELEEAWSTDEETTGLELIPNVDLDVASYERSIREHDMSGLPGAPHVEEENNRNRQAKILRVARQAMRRSVKGEPKAKVLHWAALELGEDVPKAMRVLKAIRDDHGLVGNIFVRASAFPGMHNGKWDDFLKKHAAKARYILVEPNSKMAAFDNYLGKKIVTQIPWKRVLGEYGPILKAAGYQVDTEGDPQKALRDALLRGQEKAAAPQPHREKVVMPADLVTEEEAQAAIKQADKTPAKVKKDRNATLWKRVGAQIDRWAKAGLLSDEDRLRLWAKRSTPKATLRTAAMLIAAGNSAKTYEGTGIDKLIPTDGQCSAEEAWEMLRAAKDRTQDDFEAGHRKKVEAAIGKMVHKGLLTQKEAQRICSLDKPADFLMKLATVVAGSVREQSMPKSKKAREFEGPVFKTVMSSVKADKEPDPETKRILAAAKGTGIKTGEFRKMLRSIRLAMNEGFAGTNLDDYIRVQFSHPLREAAAHLISDERELHEGLAGHLYVDAAAYASPKGVTGCDKGALKHRANAIKFVKAMERCDGCVHSNAEGTCTKYNKKLADTFEGVEEHRNRILGLSKASDAEMTAALFDNPVSEYGLDLVEVDDVPVDEGPSNETLGDVLYGGLEVEL